ncbi:MAG TPA: nucleotidyltransferase domain-containing protein [Candidatus Paceibacterota bacterium]|nr:nucleotidyltransferase domain-containing protein [Candidatus Paceibacterota bacterium]
MALPGYDRLLESLRRDKRVLAALLAGSRAKGLQTEDSDLDLYVVFKDGVSQAYLSWFRAKYYGLFFHLRLDLSNKALLALDEFEEFAQIGSEYAWDRYNVARAKIEFDKSEGMRVANLLKEKRALNQEERDKVVHEHLPDYLSVAYRSARNRRQGDALASLLDASESIQHLLWSLFALHRRVKPFSKYLRWELENFPLEGLPWDTDAFFRLIQDALAGSPAAQKELYVYTESLARTEGYGKYYDAWGGGKLGEITKED